MKIEVRLVMIHEMNLHPRPFALIAEGRKSIELRLPEELATARPEDMELYYPPEKQRHYGVVGIEIELLDETKKEASV